MENGSATPTRNENDGWIRSCSEQPPHSTCDCANFSHFQVSLSGNDRATWPSDSTSAIIRNITNPRYASSESSRGNGCDPTGLGVAICLLQAPTCHQFVQPG